MSIKTRPGFAINVDKTVKATEKKTTFYKLQPSTSTNLRFLPTSNPSGELFFLTGQHFNFEEEGEKRVWGCLRQHGEDGQECPICELIEAAQAADPEAYDKLVDKHRLSQNQHAQVIVVPKEGPVEQLFICRFTLFTAGKISDILKMERDNRQPLFTDPDNGQVINVKHNGKSGFQSRYEPQATGMRVPLDDLYPKWTEDFLDVEKETRPRVGDPEQLVESIRETVGKVILSRLLPKYA